MNLSDAAREKLASFRRDWNYTESVLKQSEFLSEEVIFPSIQELRYAGRRVVDALDELANGGGEAKAVPYLDEAIFFCLRARHDAIDAIIAVVAGNYEAATREFGKTLVHQYFPEITTELARIHRIERLIVASREHRQDRDKTYQDIARDELKHLVDGHDRFVAAEPIIIEAAKKAEAEEARRHADTREARRRAVDADSKSNWQIIWAIAGVAATVLGIVVALR